MKNLIVIKDSIENRISYYHLALFLISLPFDRFYSQLTLFSFILHVLIHINRRKLKAVFTLRQLMISSVWFVTLAGILYSPDKKNGLEDLGRQSAILLIPIFLTASGFPLQQYREKLLEIFGIICVVVIFYLFAHSFYSILYYRLPLSTLLTLPFINHNFSAPIGIHATYLSLYAGLSLVYFMDRFLKGNTNSKKIWLALAMIILLVGLLQLASRSVLLATAFIFVVVFPFFLPKGSFRLRFVVTTLLVISIALAGILSIDSFRKRYFTGLKNDLTQLTTSNETLEPRVTRWKFVMELIRHRPLLGYGSGTERELLKDIYFENKYYNSYLHGLNAHNQYLSFWLKTGIWGLAVFLLTLLYGLRIAWRKKDTLYASFLIFICTVSFSENIIDVNKGIFFYAFFLSFFTLGGTSSGKKSAG